MDRGSKQEGLGSVASLAARPKACASSALWYAGGQSCTPEEAVGQLRALVVDDSQAMRRSIIYALQRVEGMVCFEAQDGAEGLKRLASERFDIVLTDINMPIMDGLKLIAQMRLSESVHKGVPVVVITTESAPEDRRRAMALGASAYLVKPLRAATVISTVKELLGLA